jgi:soluble lytic murein transglycosylase-like protein
MTYVFTGHLLVAIVTTVFSAHLLVETWLAFVAVRAAVIALIAFVLAPAAVASTRSELVRSDAAVRAAAARWDGRGAVPRDLSRALLDFQRAELRLTPATIPELPPRLAAQVRDDVVAHTELARLTPPRPLSAFRPGPARPAAELEAAYRRAERRFGVPWSVLAAVNMVESAFGQMRETSVAGAQGPMQFMPATWRAYGLGGDVDAPADAILGAANYLHANGAPRDLRGALYHYNPSHAYVDAVLRYARHMHGSYLSYYARHLFVRTPSGLRRLSAAGPRLVVQKRKLILDAPAYKLVLDRGTGAILDMVDKAANAHLLGQIGCMWGASTADDGAYGGCDDRMTYRWSRASSTLTLTYGGDAGAVVTLAAQPGYVELRATVTNALAKPIKSVRFPADLVGRTTTVQAGYAPNYLPGIQLAPAFFTRIGNAVLTYPSRWGIADYLALDIGGGHVAVETVNPAPSPIAPVELGFRHWGSGGCSGKTYCLIHAFDTWIGTGTSWTSPIVRLRIGDPVEKTIVAYRTDNGIDAYPGPAAKVGSRLDALVRSPLIKADLWKGLHPFAEWRPELARLPSPALIHPVAFQLHGHDLSDPDFLPPDPVWGSTEDLAGAVRDAHALGQLVMPYLNVSWWTVGGETTSSQPATTVAALDAAGQPLVDRYATKGYAVSPYAPFVQSVVKKTMEQWSKDVPADCVFLDQIGARPWRYDFNPAEPTPLAYYDGWIANFAPYADRCLMVEDGWDRLAQSFVGFHGSALSVQLERQQPDEIYGAGNWRPYPLALWLFHDKVLTYQHDLYDGTMTADAQVLTWNMAFGNVLSYSWDDWHQTLDSPWLQLVGSFQKTLGPLYAGKPFTGWKTVADGITESDFGDFAVTANWTDTAYQGIAAHGFAAHGPGVFAGALTGSLNDVPLSGGTHYLLVNGLTVSQPVGDDTDLGITVPAGTTARVSAVSTGGIVLGEVPSHLTGATLVFHYASSYGAEPVGSYRLG